MKIWMDVMRDLEHVMNDHERLFDAWAAGGVEGLVIGPLEFDTPRLLPNLVWEPRAGKPTDAFAPNPRVYERFGVPTPPAPEPRPEKGELLERTLNSAKRRGWSVYLFQVSHGAALPADRGHPFADDRVRDANAARMVDALERFPMADGAIMDGPEWGYEVDTTHMNRRHQYLFDELPETLAPLCTKLGYDYASLVTAKDRLFDRLHTLDGGRTTELTTKLHKLAGESLPARFEALTDDPDLAAWLRFRRDTHLAYFRSVRQRIASELARPVSIGIGPRTAAFAPLAGYDAKALAAFMDMLLPKHYFWHRGFDGLLGTVGRYTQTLLRWNPELSESAAIDLVLALFDVPLPGVRTLVDLEFALTPEFFREIVGRETRRALAAVDDPTRIVPWVETGRHPHDGDPMTADHLRQMLEASRAAGLQRFLYHHHGNLTAGEWTVMTSLCGTPWSEVSSDYRPPDAHVL